MIAKTKKRISEKNNVLTLYGLRGDYPCDWRVTDGVTDFSLSPICIKLLL